MIKAIIILVITIAILVYKIGFVKALKKGTVKTRYGNERKNKYHNYEAEDQYLDLILRKILKKEKKN